MKKILKISIFSALLFFGGIKITQAAVVTCYNTCSPNFNNYVGTVTLDLQCNGSSPASYTGWLTVNGVTIAYGKSCAVAGSCGPAQGAYAASSTDWRYPLCNYGAATIGSSPFLAEGETKNWLCKGTNGGADASCSATRAATVVNGSCGAAQGGYLVTDSVWRSPACNIGTANVALGSFLNYGETRNWSCIGSGPGHSDASCSANRALAVPDVYINANPITVSLNNSSANISVKSTNLSWGINNSAVACGAGCSCVGSSSGGEWGGSKSYPASNVSVAVSPVFGAHTYTLSCTNPNGVSRSATTTVNASCNAFSWASACSKPCGDGQITKHNLNTSCVDSPTFTPCNLGACPLETGFEEVRP